MIAQINRTRIIEWIEKLQVKKGSSFQGYTWKLLSKDKACEYDNPDKEFWLYGIIFYDRNGDQYALKHIGTELDSSSTLDQLARSIIHYSLWDVSLV